MFILALKLGLEMRFGLHVDGVFGFGLVLCFFGVLIIGLVHGLVLGLCLTLGPQIHENNYNKKCYA